MKQLSLPLSLALFALTAPVMHGDTYTVTPHDGSSSKLWSAPSTWVGNPPDYPNSFDDHIIFNGGADTLHLRVEQAVQNVGSITHSGTATTGNRITARNGVDALLTIGTLTQSSPANLHLVNKSFTAETGTLDISVGTLNVSNGSILEIGRSTMGNLGGFNVTGTSNIAGAVMYNGVQNEEVGKDIISLGNVNLTGYITFGAIQSANDAHRVIKVNSLTGDGYFTLNHLSGTAVNASGTIELHNAAGTVSTYDGRFRLTNKSIRPDGTLTLVKLGAGTQIFTNNHSDHSATLIREGVLAVDNVSAGTIYALGYGAVTVEESGTLAGTGFVRTRDVVTAKEGGRIFASAHLDNEVAKLTISGADRAVGETILEMQAGSSFAFRFTSDEAHDQIAFTSYKAGGLIFDSSGIAIDVEGVTEGDFTLFTFNSIDNGELQSLAGLLRMGDGFAGYTATFDYATNAITMNVQAIPEPGSVALGVFGLIGFSLWRKMTR